MSLGTAEERGEGGDHPSEPDLSIFSSYLSYF